MTAVTTAVAAAAFAAAAGAQTSQTPLSPHELISLTGPGCAVRYTAGGLDRAHHVLRRIELLTGSFNQWSEVPTPTVVYLLNRDEWRRGGLPDIYGVPLRVGPSRVVAPIVGDPESVAFWRRKLGVNRLPMIPGVPLVGSVEEAAAMAIADVLLQVEACRGFVQRAGLVGRQAWIGEVMAHAVAQALFLRHEGARTSEIAATYRRLGDRLGGAGARSLNSFRSLSAAGTEGLEDWLWFQAQFYAGGEQVVEKKGSKTVKRLLAMAERGSGLVTEAELLQAYPDLRAWLTDGFAPVEARR